MFDILILGMGVYVVICAIRGKGKLFVYPNVKEGKEKKFLTLLRTIYGVLGGAMVINGGLSLLTNSVLYTISSDGTYTPNYELGAWSFLTPEVSGFLTILFMIVAGGCIIAVYVLARKMTDRNAPAKESSEAQNRQRPTQPGSRMPSAAFDFDEESETK